jgi:hypothetical protein
MFLSPTASAFSSAEAPLTVGYELGALRLTVLGILLSVGLTVGLGLGFGIGGWPGVIAGIGSGFGVPLALTLAFRAGRSRRCLGRLADRAIGHAGRK